MFAPILLILAPYGYLPSNYRSEDIILQIEKLIEDSLENPRLLEPVHKINTLLGINLHTTIQKLEDSPGPYCAALQTNLECRCECKSCKYQDASYSWNCKRLGTIEEEFEDTEVESSLQEFNTSVNLLENCLEADFEYPKNISYCVKCGKSGSFGTFGKHYSICKSCQASMNAVTTQALLLEVRFGRPVREIINYVIRMWDTIQHQAKVLGVRPENFQSLCSNYNINMKRYRQVGDSRFINPFLNRKKGRPLIDSYILRLYSTYLRNFQHKPIRKEVRSLEKLLLTDANQLLYLRELELFDIPLN